MRKLALNPFMSFQFCATLKFHPLCIIILEWFMNAEIIGIMWLLKCYRGKNRRSLLCWVFSARIKLRVCSFCFNLDPFPSPLVRISPINTTTSLKQLFCCLWQKGEQTTKSDALWSDNNLTFCAPAERIKWWEKKESEKHSCLKTWGLREGHCGSVMYRHPQSNLCQRV